MPNPMEDVATLGEVARMINCTPQQIRYAIESKKIPDVPVRSGRRFFTAQDILNLKEAMGEYARTPKHLRAGAC